MKKTFKSLLGIALALVMCLTMAPATTAKADEAVALSEYTENQLLTAFMGEWEGNGYSLDIEKNHITIWDCEYNEDRDRYDKTVEFMNTDWTYDGVAELEGRLVDAFDWEAVQFSRTVEKVDGIWVDNDGTTYTEDEVTDIYEEEEEGVVKYYGDGKKKPDTRTKALKFTSEDYTFYIYAGRGYNLDWGEANVSVLSFEYVSNTTDNSKVIDVLWKCNPDPYSKYSKTLTVFNALDVAVEDGNKIYEPKFVATPMADTDAEIDTDSYDIEYKCDENDDYIRDENGELIAIGQSWWVRYADDIIESHIMDRTATENGYPVEYEVYKYEYDENGNEVEVTLKSGTYYFKPDTEVKEEPAATPEPTETPIEEPKTEEPTGEAPAVETEDKEIVEKTKDGRPVYTGETVYIVKKGDCLWNIAKQLLGSGARYKELLTRNNGIIEKAKLIFPGQEVIVPAK